MASVRIEGDTLVIGMSMIDELLSFHGGFNIPLRHVTRAYTGTRQDLELKWRLLGTGAGSLKTAGIFTTPEGIVFCDLAGDSDCLIVETRGERFPRLALTLDPGENAASIAKAINKR